MGVSLLLQKRLASSVLKCGKRKIWLDPNEVNEISMANSRAPLPSCPVPMQGARAERVAMACAPRARGPAPAGPLVRRWRPPHAAPRRARPAPPSSPFPTP